MKKIKVEDISHQGYGVAFDEGKVHFIWDALPGEEVLVQVLEDKKRFAIGKVIQREGKSEARIEGQQPYPYAPFMHVKDEYRAKVLQKQLQRVLSLDSLPPFHLSPKTMYYRNKAQIPVRESYFKDVSLGYHDGDFKSFVAKLDFGIYDERIEVILEKIEKVIRKHGISSYNPQTKEGTLRHVICRQSQAYDEILIIFVTNSSERLPQSFVEAIQKLDSNIVGIVQNIQDDGSSLILSDKMYTLWGRDYYFDKLLGIVYPIKAASFYQVNTAMTEKLYQRAFELADLKKTDRVLDAYAGISTIALSLASQVDFVESIEIEKTAVAMARKVAEREGIQNISILEGDVNEHLASLEENVDVLFVDPPRRGLSQEFMEHLLESKIEKIVYISCHPQSLARDLKVLGDVYAMTAFEAFDMFPKTEHVESLALLEKKDLSI